MGTYAHVRLLLCSAVIALTARGFPANRNIMPSPLRRNRPATLFYPHRKLSRPWLVTLQEDLWRDGPSGDGPGDDTWSKLIPSAKSHVGYVSESEYKTHSPSAEDFFTTQALPFPTVIDTMMDESSTFGEEWISRTSMPYEGPSSLLNSFIFRPSVPYISPSSMKTPSLEESLPDSESAFPSWWDPSSVWKMSTRQAVSDAISDHYFIITAISATHIYSETEQTSYSDSISSKLLPEVSSIFSTFSVQEYLVTKKSDSLDEMSSSTNIIITETTLPAFSTRRQFYTSVGEKFSSPYDFGYSPPLDEVHQSSISNILTSSPNISLSDGQTYFYSNTFSSRTDKPYILTRSYSNDFDNSIFKDSSPYADLSDYEVDKNTVFTFEQTWAKSVSLVTTEILYDFNGSFYTTTPFTSFITSNIQTTVTYIDYDSQSDRFIMPTLTIRGTPSISSHSDDMNEMHISSSHSEIKTEMPHIASSFTDFNDIIPVISLWSLDSSPAENIISLADTKTYVKESYSEEFHKLTPKLSSTSRFTPLTVRPAFTSTYSLFSENEIAKYSLPSELSKLRSEMITLEDKQKSTVIEQFERYYSLSSEQMFSSTTSQQDVAVDVDSKFSISMGESWANEIGADKSLSLSKQSTDIPLSHIKSASTLGWNAISVDIDPFGVLTRISHPTTLSSINTDDLFSSVLIPSMGTITERYESQQEMTPTIASAFEIMSTNDETGDIKENLQTQYGSATEFIDSSTHHVTVRSLSSSSHIDIIESMLLNFVTSRESDIDKVPKLTYTHTLSPVFTSSDLLVDNTTKLEENTHLQEEINTQEYSPTYLESSFQDHRNLSYTSSSSAKYNGQYSQLSSDPRNAILPFNYSTDGWHPSLKRTGLGTSIFKSLDSQLYEMTPHFTIISEVYSKSKLFDSSNIETEEVSEKILHRVSESIDSEDKQISLTKMISPESGKTRNLFESALVSTIQPKPSFTQKVSRNEGLISTVTFDSENGIKSIESFNLQLQSSITGMHTQVRPSQTLLDSSDITQLESIEFKDLSTDKQFTGGSEFLATSNQEASQIKIDSSTTFSSTMESEQTGVSPYIKKDTPVSENLYPETPILDGSINFSTKDYLSKDILHPSNNIPEGELTRVETYSYFLLTPTFPLEISRHITKRPTIESEDYERSFAQLFSEKTLALMPDAVSDSAVFNTGSKSLSSESDYPSRSEFEYTGREDSPIYQSEFHSGMLLQSASFETHFNFDQESAYDYHSLQLTVKPSLATLSKFDWDSKLNTELISKNLVNSESSIFSSGDTSEFYSQTLQLTPSQPITMHKESSFLDASSRETDSRLDIPSEFTKGESDIYSYTPVFTPDNPISTFESSIWIGKLVSETTSIHSGISVPLIPVFSSYDTSLTQHVPETEISYPSIMTESSPMAGVLESEIFHSIVDTSQLLSLGGLGGFIPQPFSSGTISKVYQTPEISPSQTTVTHEKSHWIGRQQPQEEFSQEFSQDRTIQSRKGLSLSDDILGFISGQESTFYQTPVILSSRTITQVRSDCAVSPCLVPGNEPQNTEDKTILRGSSFLQHETLTLFSIGHSLISNDQVSTENVPYAFSSPSYVQTLRPEDLHKTKEPVSVESEFSIRKSETKSNLHSGIILQSSTLGTYFSFNQESEYNYHTLHLTTQQTPKLDLPFNQIYSDSYKSSDSKITESDYSIKSVDPKSIESDCSTKTAVPKSIESNYPIKTEVLKSIEDYYPETAIPESIESDFSTKIVVPKSIESDYSTKIVVPGSIESDYATKSAAPVSIESDFSTKTAVIKTIESNYSITSEVPKSIESDYFTKTAVPKSIESDYSTKIAVPKSIDSDYSTKSAVPVSIESDYSTKTAVIKTIESDYSITTVVPKSIASDYSTKIAIPVSIESDYPTKTAVIKSIESDYYITTAVPKSIASDYSTKTAVPQSIESDYSTKSTTPVSMKSDYSTKTAVPKSIESDYSTKIAVPKSIESDYSTKSTAPVSMESDYSTKTAIIKSVESDYSITTAVPKSIESDYSIKIAVPKSIESDYSIKTAAPASIESGYSTKAAVPKSIESSYSTKTAVPKSIESYYSSKHSDTKSLKSDYSVKKPDPKSIESDHPLFSIHLTTSVLPSSTLFSLRETPLSSFTPFLPVFTPLITATPKSITASKVDTKEITSVWEKESSTLGYDIEMASVLAISSFFGNNGTRNASTGLENGGIPESEWSKTDVRPTPSIDLTLFKDNNYWILTVLEAPVKGHLPENFSQTLETRLANAYSEAFRSRSPKQDSSGPEDKVVVKILSLTNDLLLSQLDVVYVVERGGKLVPATLASEILNFLRHEQLREFLGLYAILKAKPYRPDESAESHPVSSSIPVVTIVCSILGFLLFLFCCFCVYCRCCRPKQAEETSPSSSVSGSLQRSLAKHGQHNRKHLFQEMAHHLTTEMATQRKQESVAPDIYMPEKEPPPEGKSLPPLPSKEHEEAIDKAIKMLKILENKDASTSPESGKRSAGHDKRTGEAATETDTKKKLPKPKKRRKTRESEEKSSKKEVNGNIDVSELRPLPPVPKEEGDSTATPDENRASPDSGTSSRHTSSSPASTSEKTSEELGSDGSNTELLPPLQDLIAKSKADSEAAAADTQIHLSRVRQRISELLDDAFALANGRKFYGSMRSKKIDPATEMFPRYASLRSQSAAESSVTRSEEESTSERRPISEGAQHLLGTITDDGQLITRPPPKSVWGHGEQEDASAEVKYPEVTEAHNRHVNFFPFQQQSKLRQVSSSSSSSQLLPPLDPLQESEVAASTLSTINVLRDAASEVYLAHSSKIHPAAVDQYDEIDVVSALREGEPVADLIRAIKDELHKFSGAHNESNA